MTPSRPTPPQRRTNTSTKPASQTTSVQKPYALVPLPKEKPKRNPPVGQDSYKTDHISGKLFLTLTVQTPSFIASGIVALGKDVSAKIPLIKTTVQQNRILLIPGSSLKGVVRSVYEAITQSCLCKTKVRSHQLPTEAYTECKIRKDNKRVCPACQIFGAMGWQGLVQFLDCVGSQSSESVGYLASLHAPQARVYNKETKQKENNPHYFDGNGRVRGRKFYYHAMEPEEKSKRGVPIQQASTNYTFTTQIVFKNLSKEQVGALLIAIGQDSNKENQFALKVGGGKPVGMGTMTVEVTAIERTETKQQLCDRYSSYVPPESDRLTGQDLTQFIQRTTQAAKDQKLVQEPQLRELAAILQYPTDRTAPEGMY